MTERTIYLAGPIEHADNVHEWRETVTEYVNSYDCFEDVSVLNPLELYDGSLESAKIVLTPYQVPAEHRDAYLDTDENEAGYVETDDGEYISSQRLVNSDKQLIDEADGMFVRDVDVVRTGTPMEVMYAYQQHTAIVAWRDDDGHPSPWLAEHCDWWDTNWKSAFRSLLRILDGRKP